MSFAYYEKTTICIKTFVFEYILGKYFHPHASHLRIAFNNYLSNVEVRRYNI